MSEEKEINETKSPAPDEWVITEEKWQSAKNQWLHMCINNSPVARNTEAFNHVGNIIDKLWLFLRSN